MPYDDKGVVSILTRPVGGCYRGLKNGQSNGNGFNPHPPTWAGATIGNQAIDADLVVSILTRPRGRVLPVPRFSVPELEDVSILTRPRGRVLPGMFLKVLAVNAVSILTRPRGRVLRCPCGCLFFSAGVSILTRPRGRVLRPINLARTLC